MLLPPWILSDLDVDTSNYQHLVIALTLSSALLVGIMLSFALAGSFVVALLCYFAIAKGVSIKVALLVSTIALIPAIALYRGVLGVSSKRKKAF